MSFTSLGYFPLLAAVAVVFRFLPERARNCFLLLVSWWIYLLYGWQHFMVLLCVTAFSYLAGRWITEIKNPHVKKWLMILSVSGMVGFLLCSKWAGLPLTNKRMIPVGISFYIFQALSYLIDVYHGENVEKNWERYALYLGFFPQVVAGPIEQAGKLIPQLSVANAKRDDISAGISYILSGCVRKFVIADGMSRIVDPVYSDVYNQSGISLFLATIFFAIQIYGDFSGYTHIAIGSARLFGIRLTENFERPYLAEGCRDFWKRWHITLTHWFTKYLYIPLGGNKKKYRNIMLVFLVSGLWHGMDLTFLCWGAYFGVWRIVEDLVNKKISFKGCLVVRRSITFLLVCFSWVFFRSTTVAEAGEVFWRIFTMQKGMVSGFGVLTLTGGVARILLLASLPFIFRKQNDEKKRYYRNASLIILIIVGMIFNFQHGGGSSFIYFQF